MTLDLQKGFNDIGLPKLMFVYHCSSIYNIILLFKKSLLIIHVLIPLNAIYGETYRTITIFDVETRNMV